MPRQSAIASAETVIVGAGIVGCSIAYHLAEMGYTDVLVLDRGKVSNPLGSTGHAPGLLGRNSASSLMAALADYTSELFARMPEHNPALIRNGSIEVARDERRLHQLQYKVKAAAANGIDARLVSPEEIGKLVPYIDTKPIIGGIFVPGDGVLDARRALSALFEEAAGRGIGFREETTVIGFQTAGDRITGVVTEGGIINCSRVVVAVGIWGSELLEPLGIELPLFAVQHPYVWTEPLDMLTGAASQGARPLVRDLDNLFYLREHGDRLGFGWYNHKPLTIDPKSISKADIAFPERGFLDAVSYELFPFLQNTPLSFKLNGIFSMTPDGGPLLGRVKDRPGLWVAEAIWVTHAGGVGKAMAELLLDRAPSFDIAAFRPDRFTSINNAAARLAALTLYNDIYAWPTEVASAE